MNIYCVISRKISFFSFFCQGNMDFFRITSSWIFKNCFKLISDTSRNSEELQKRIFKPELLKIFRKVVPHDAGAFLVKCTIPSSSQWKRISHGHHHWVMHESASALADSVDCVTLTPAPVFFTCCPRARQDNTVSVVIPVIEGVSYCIRLIGRWWSGVWLKQKID